MSLEAEMMLEQLKEQHLHEMEELRSQLEIKVSVVVPQVFNVQFSWRKGKVRLHGSVSELLAFNF